ncbi:hypothetical protein BC829DRAFT_223329 [Chytridium lagenaria]|nr:hypothetical protein BC829DRAFT_223329 [Chytridium lagenaria]
MADFNNNINITDTQQTTTWTTTSHPILLNLPHLPKTRKRKKAATPKRLSYLSELEKNSHELSARVQRIKEKRDSLVTSKATDYVFMDVEPNPARPVSMGSTLIASPTSPTTPLSLSDQIGDATSSPTFAPSSLSTSSTPSPPRNRKSGRVLSDSNTSSDEKGKGGRRRSVGLFETKISMDRQGSSGLASLVSSLAETAERKASKKAAPPPMPDKSWPKVRELVKSLEKTKVPDAAEPTSPQPPHHVNPLAVP